MTSTIVLVVDDEPLVRLYAVDLLHDSGYEAIEANDAEEALAQFEQRPDITVLFTDINLPGAIDGIGLAQWAHRHRPGVQLIITSGRLRPGPQEIPDSSHFVPKPYQAASVIGLIRPVGA